VRIRGAELATPQADCFEAGGDAALGEQAFDIAEAYGEPKLFPSSRASAYAPE